jgi:ketopantoate reductase
MCGFMEAVLVDESFVTAASEPNDIDLVLVTASSYNLSTDLPPVNYNLLSQHRVRRRIGFDIVRVKNGSENLEQAVAFFAHVKQQPGIRKGILRIKL